MKGIFFLVYLFVSINSFSQGILGEWKILDPDGKVNSTVNIYIENNLYYGKIIKVMREGYTGICDTCIGKYKNKDLVGAVILTAFSKETTTYENGEVTDPENGKTYSLFSILD